MVTKVVLPKASTLYSSTFTELTPTSAPLIVPLLSVSNQTRLPRLNVPTASTTKVSEVGLLLLTGEPPADAVKPPTGMILTTQSIEDVKLNDYFELYIANETNDDDITVSSGNVHIIELG